MLLTTLTDASTMPADALARVFAALGDPTRLDIVERLAAGGDTTATNLAESYDLSFQAVAKHLRVLEDSGLVTRTKDAQRRPVHLEAQVFELMTAWIERYRRQADARYRRLDALLAASPEVSDDPPTPTANNNTTTRKRSPR